MITHLWSSKNPNKTNIERPSNAHPSSACNLHTKNNKSNHVDMCIPCAKKKKDLDMLVGLAWLIKQY
jgi:hypothetical protein